MTWLGYIDEQLSSIINYELGLWTNEQLVFPYWVGEYQEVDYSHELHYHEYYFTLTGTTKGSIAQLEQDKEKILNIFSSHTSLIEDGHSIAVFYDTAFLLPCEDETIRRLQINLTIKEWRD
jgi:hypothetical protein